MTTADLLRAGMLAIALQLVAACDDVPPPGELPIGSLPSTGGSFVVTKPGSGISSQTVGTVVGCLMHGGMAPVGAPAYFVQLSQSLRLGKTVVLIPDPAPPAPPAPPGSAAAAKHPVKPKLLYQTLTVSISNFKSQEQFRASATQALRKSPGAADNAALTDQLCRTILNHT